MIPNRAGIAARTLMSYGPEVESIPGKVSGAWVFRGTRVPVSAIFENLKCSPLDEVLENFPSRGNRCQFWILWREVPHRRVPHEDLAG